MKTWLMGLSSDQDIWDECFSITKHNDILSAFPNDRIASIIIKQEHTFPEDSSVFAVAIDEIIGADYFFPWCDINDPEDVMRFINDRTSYSHGTDSP